jgi:hypothetical protein
MILVTNHTTGKVGQVAQNGGGDYEIGEIAAT